MPRLRVPTLFLLLLAGCAGADADPDAVAAEVLGPGVRGTATLPVGGAGWIAAVGDLPVDVPDPLDAARRVSRYAYEVVLLRPSDGGWEPVPTGLFVLDAADARRRAEVDGAPAPLDAPASLALEHFWGVQDADGDGAADLWAVQAYGTRPAFRLDVRVYSAARGRLYRLQVPGDARGPDSARREFSFNVMDSPAAQRWLTARADSVAALWTSARPGGR